MKNGFDIPFQWLLDALIEAAAAQLALRKLAEQNGVTDAEREFALQQATLQVQKFPQVAALRSSRWATSTELELLRKTLRTLKP